MRVGAGRCKSPRDGGVGGRGAGERSRGGRRAKRGTVGALREKTEATATAFSTEIRRGMSLRQRGGARPHGGQERPE